MLKSTFDLLSYGILGYIFAGLGVVVGFIVFSILIISLKPQKYKKMDNIIMDTYVNKKTIVKKDELEELSEIDQSEIIDETDDDYFDECTDGIVNDPITYSEILSSISNEEVNTVVAQHRSQEDNKYSIIKRKMKDIQQNQ